MIVAPLLFFFFLYFNTPKFDFGLLTGSSGGSGADDIGSSSFGFHFGIGRTVAAAVNAQSCGLGVKHFTASIDGLLCHKNTTD
jgi:hypothetical protein